MLTLANRSHFFLNSPPGLIGLVDQKRRQLHMFFGKSTTAQITNEMGAGVLPTTKYYTPPPPSYHNLQHHQKIGYVTTYLHISLASSQTSNMTNLDPEQPVKQVPSLLHVLVPLVLFSALSLRISACNIITPPSTAFAPSIISSP